LKIVNKFSKSKEKQIYPGSLELMREIKTEGEFPKFFGKRRSIINNLFVYMVYGFEEFCLPSKEITRYKNARNILKLSLKYFAK